MIVKSTMLKSLEIMDCYSLSRRSFATVGTYCRQLQAINFCKCKVNDDEIALICKNNPALSDINLSCIESLTSKGFVAVGKNCHELRWVSYEGSKVTDDGMKYLAENNPNLRYIFLLECFNLTKETGEALARYCPQVNIDEAEWMKE